MPVTIDVETTTFQKGNPFSRCNRLCSVGIRSSDSSYHDYDIEYSDTPYGDSLRNIKQRVEEAELIIGFNIKFDIHWLRRYIDDLVFPAVWDCQLAEYILSGQSNPYPSLDNGLRRCGLEPKLDVVRSEYWSRGIDTPEIPWDILAEYQKQDVIQTYELYLKQKETFENGDPRLYELFKIQCMDILVLEDAEFQGMLLNVGLANERAKLLEREIEGIRTELGQFCEGAPDGSINWSSSDHVSAILYGGTITYKLRVPTKRVLKDGTVKEGTKWGTAELVFRGLVKPLAQSELLATKGMSDRQLEHENFLRQAAGRRPIQRLYSTDEGTLRSIKGGGTKVKRLVELLLKLSALEKLHGTYYKGLPEKIKEMDWPEGKMHGNFNVCVVPTGRLSSSNPNLQNLAGKTKELYVSRYEVDASYWRL